MPMGSNGASGDVFVRDSTRSKAVLVVDYLWEIPAIFLCSGGDSTISGVGSTLIIFM